MIYVVKCYSCEHEFRVKRGETGADMMCPECGTANNIRDVIERIEEKKGIDPDVAAIKDFDMSEHPVCDGVEWESAEKRRWDSRINSVLLLILLLELLLDKLGVIDFFAWMEKLKNIFN